jgi:Protein of unknown function DUF262/Protein of unknown function (DUF1524)
VPANPERINFDHLGIGEMLSSQRLRVPLNQREYSWEEEHVDDLCSDLANGHATSSAYFLGTIVLTSGGDERVPEVSDGQQRLSTAMIMLAAVRDWFQNSGDETRAKAIEDTYLFTVDLATTNRVPKLSLNVDDNDFFIKRILSRPGDGDRKTKPTRDSHSRLIAASLFATKKLAELLEPYKDEHKPQRLVSWVEYIKTKAQVIVLGVPDQIDAFVMFETLNDRGLKISQADLLKNYLLRLATKERIQEAQQTWARMIGVLESIGEGDITVTYLHHFLITTSGPTKERQVFDRVKQQVNNSNAALEFLSNLGDGANDYAALYNADHNKWNAYESAARKSIATINRDLQVAQIRPLMFAVARTFAPKEATLAFRMFVAWSVRFLIVGGRGGLLDRNYALLAALVGGRKITTARQLADVAVKDIVPNDSLFETSFATARVSQARLARYYLRALEKQRKKEDEPEWVPSDDEKAINLEHVLPENPGDEWPAVRTDDALAHYRRLGNLAILQAKRNSLLGNKGFAEKRETLGTSTFAWTSEIAKNEEWGPKQIEVRQRMLARVAVETWPLRL